MTRQEMIAVVDGEIERLERVRELLHRSAKSKFVNPPVAAQKAGSKQKRELSAEGRRRIALAQKRRWAKDKREPGAADEGKK